MKKLYLTLTFLFGLSCFSQQSEHYEYYLYLNDYINAPVFKKTDNISYYTGKDLDMKSFFDKYSIINFYQAFPEYEKSEQILRVYLLTTLDKNLIFKLIDNYPNLFSKYDDITGRKIIPLSYYPNDYGNTSPVTNLGADVRKKDLDYLDVPKAWDITKGSNSVRIGISDSAVDVYAPDFLNKVTLVSGAVSDSGPSHGSDVAAIAAARGDNGHGAVGVCMDCDIISAPMSYYALYDMANNGARIINMSWTSSGYVNWGNGYIQVEQDLINYLVKEFQVVFVGASGNMTSYSTPQSYHSIDETGLTPWTPFGILHVYPASYDNVLSVSSVNHLNPLELPMNNLQSSYCCTSSLFPIHTDIEDSIGRSVSALNPMNPVSVRRNGFYQHPWDQDGLTWMNTTNERVDIVAPGYDIFQYSYYLNGLNSQIYGGGTSYSAPMVSGTIGLMLSIMECMSVKEIESILKVTTKDIESMSLNQEFAGHIGAGSLNTGNSVKFVDQMKSDNGNAIIKNHRFNRFDFNLSRINNKLTIENVIFSELNTSTFVAKNKIEIINSDFSPGANGFIDLKIDENINVNCQIVQKVNKEKKYSGNSDNAYQNSKLFPNPNNGTFNIELSQRFRGAIIEIFDIFGKSLYSINANQTSILMDLPNLTEGLYLVKISDGNSIETLKFIKK